LRREHCNRDITAKNSTRPLLHYVPVAVGRERREQLIVGQLQHETQVWLQNNEHLLLFDPSYFRMRLTVRYIK